MRVYICKVMGVFIGRFPLVPLAVVDPATQTKYDRTMLAR